MYEGHSGQIRQTACLGGRLTSLIDSVNTHFLVRDVRVDLPGRDRVRDFLALDGDTLRVYESDSIDTAVTDESSFSSFTSLGGARRFSAETYHREKAAYPRNSIPTRFPPPSSHFARVPCRHFRNGRFRHARG